MRICLINAPIATDYRDPTEFNSEPLRRDCCYPQLGILSLAAVLENAGYSTEVFDINRAYFRFADSNGGRRINEFVHVFADEIAATEAEVYGFGSICSGYPVTLQLARLVKSRRPLSTILLGGPQASVVAEQTLLAFPFVDFILRGEAELTLPVFLDELRGRREFHTVPGLVHRSPFGVHRNGDSPPVADLDSLPFPAYHLTDELRGATFASLEVGRGCPFACAFCSTNDFFRRKYRLRSPQRVLEDMRSIEAAYGIRSFQLNHDMFTVDAKRVREFCRFMIASGSQYTWNCCARTDCIDEDLIQLMVEAGCREIFFGVETGSARMQKIIDKHLDISRAHQIIDIVARAGIASVVSLIIGFPEETWDDVSQTLTMFMHAARTPKSKPQLLLLAPLANTPIHIRHRHELTLQGVCSEMCRQGRYQADEDAELIRQYPDIFSSFYIVPTPHLDRAILSELREFLSNALWLRWLLAAAAQSRDGMAAVFLEWVKTRRSLHPELGGTDLRWYYRLALHRRELCIFLRQYSAPHNRRVKLLLDFYDAMAKPDSDEQCLHSDMEELECHEAVSPEDVVVRKNQIVELEWDLMDVIRMVNECKDGEPRRRQRFYMVPGRTSPPDAPVCEVSVFVAKLAALCDGLPTVSGLIQRLTRAIVVTPKHARPKVYMTLIEEARDEGVISILRKLPRMDHAELGVSQSHQNSTASEANRTGPSNARPCL